MWVLLVSTVFILLCLFKDTFQRKSFYPPGPPCIPLVGNLISLWLSLRTMKTHHEVWQAWSRKYGKLLGLKLCGKNVVIVFGKDLIKEVSSREAFEGRPDGFFYLLRSFEKKLGLVFAEGPAWNATRRVVLKYLKNFGFGTGSMEQRIIDEGTALVELRTEDAGRPVTVNNMFHIPIVNILWAVMAGKRYDLKDEQLLNITHLITKSFKVLDMSGGILNFMPFLRHVVPDSIGYTTLKNIHEDIYKYIKATIDEHRNGLDPKNPRDVIDALLIDMKEQKNNACTEESLQVVCLDMLQAGMETVSHTMEYTLLYVALNENVQRKIRKEIDDVIGKRTPALSDRTKMVYTEATILEALRISTVPAVGVPHMALEDAVLDRYVIPKGTLILLAMHDLHNGTHWKDPEVFRPERFLTRDGNLILDESYMPFGIGRRRCIGENLAKSQLFLFLIQLMQKFYLKFPEGEPLPSTEPVDGITLSLRPFKMCFVPRNSF